MGIEARSEQLNIAEHGNQVQQDSKLNRRLHIAGAKESFIDLTSHPMHDTDQGQSIKMSKAFQFQSVNISSLNCTSI